MKKLLLLFLLLFCLYTHAQTIGKEAWHWQFGQNVAIDFSSGNPIVGASKIIVNEGCASISDPNTGQLLFYTDGDSVWDRNNNRMPNGIGLINGTQGTTTQAATIIPKPGSKNIYYIVTADYSADVPNGIYYSVVDMNLNGGMGDIIIKNTLLTPPQTTEKVVATRHCNGQDYWILNHSYGSNNFNAYLVTSSGINPNPVISSVGTIIQTVCCGTFEAIGYLKVSPNGKKIAACVSSFSPNPFLEIYDFDNTTGIVSNPIKIQVSNNGGNFNGPYGCTFSPDNTKLYMAVGGSFSNNLFQYDISSGLQNTIIASCDTFGTNTYRPAAMQIAPNGKIYVAGGGVYSNDTLGVINFPNNLGNSCNYQPNGLPLANNTYVTAGLPNFIDGGLQQNTFNMHDVIMCNTFSPDTLDAGTGYAHYFWSNGDTTQKTVITTAGKFWVNKTNTQGCIATDTINAYIVSPDNFNLLNDTIVCSLNGTYQANVGYNGILNYNWSNGSTYAYSTYTTTGICWVDYTVGGGCVIRDSFKLNLSTKPKINLGHDTLYCGQLNQGIILHTNAAANYTYLWSTNATTDSIIAYTTNKYWVKASSALTCFTYDTISLVIDNLSNPNILHDTILCNSNQFPIILNATTPTLNQPGAYNFYYWQGGHSGAYYNITSPGIYIVNISLHDGSGSLYCKIVDTAKVLLGCTSIEKTTRHLFKFYPNPAQNVVTIEVENLIDITLLDVLGNQLITTKQNQLNVSNLTNSVYFIQVQAGQSTTTQKMIVQH